MRVEGLIFRSLDGGLALHPNHRFAGIATTKDLEDGEKPPILATQYAYPTAAKAIGGIMRKYAKSVEKGDK